MALSFLFVGFGFAESGAKRLCVYLGEEFTLHKNWSAVLRGEDYEVEVVGFVYSPCPPGARCVWSGLGVVLRHKLGEEVKEGINLTMAFGYLVKLVETDYRTYAKLKIYKADSEKR